MNNTAHALNRTTRATARRTQLMRTPDTTTRNGTINGRKYLPSKRTSVPPELDRRNRAGTAPAAATRLKTRTPRARRSLLEHALANATTNNEPTTTSHNVRYGSFATSWRGNAHTRRAWVN